MGKSLIPKLYFIFLVFFPCGDIRRDVCARKGYCVSCQENSSLPARIKYMSEGGNEMSTATKDVAQATRDIVAPWKGKKGGIIPILQKVQQEFGYLPDEAMVTISEETKVALAELYGVATFYAQFHLKPRGRHIIRVCRGTACHVRGSLGILERVNSELELHEGEVTTSDLRFTVEPVACIGACGLAPCVMVDDETYGRLTKDKVPDMLSKYE